jgi:hypothetical protein
VTVQPRSTGGRPRRFDLETRRRRRYEQNYRKRLIDAAQVEILAERNPKIHNQTRALAERQVAAKRGPLPGDEESQ